MWSLPPTSTVSSHRGRRCDGCRRLYAQFMPRRVLFGFCGECTTRLNGAEDRLREMRRGTVERVHSRIDKGPAASNPRKKWRGMVGLLGLALVMLKLWLEMR